MIRKGDDKGVGEDEWSGREGYVRASRELGKRAREEGKGREREKSAREESDRIGQGRGHERG